MGRLTFAVRKDCFPMDPCTFMKCAHRCISEAKEVDKPVQSACDDATKKCCCRYYEWHPSPPPPKMAGVAAAVDGDEDGGFLG